MIYKSCVLVKEGIEIVINQTVLLGASLIAGTLQSFFGLLWRAHS